MVVYQLCFALLRSRVFPVWDAVVMQVPPPYNDFLKVLAKFWSAKILEHPSTGLLSISETDSQEQIFRLVFILFSPRR
jgi:hypothetical protein